MIQYKTFLLVDDKGRVTIPVKVREWEGMSRGTGVTLTYENGKIIIEKEGEEKNEN